MNNTPPEILEQWQNDFNEWIDSQFWGECIQGEERSRFIKVWVAARQTVRIPLPELISDDAGGYQMFAGDVKASIESAGYRVLVNQQPAGQGE